MKKNIIVFLSVFIVSCGSEPSDPGNGGGTKVDNFNRKEMLTFWANEIIVPAYTDFSGKTKKLEDAVKSFTDTPTIEELAKVRNQWKEAYISWQKASLFQIGEAQVLNMTGQMNTYPTDVESLKNYVVKGTYNLEATNLYNEQGFPALDYLLYGIGSEEETVAFYANIDNVGYVKYIKDISIRINALATKVNDSWKGSYKKEFIENDGSSTTSSVDKLVNYYAIPFYEKQLREPKIVIPAGVRTGIVVPTAAEGYYSKTFSKTLYVTALKATTEFFNGTSYDGTKKGVSLQQYLEFLNRKDLSDAINTNFSKLSSLSSTLEDNFSSQVQDAEKRKKMLNVFDALQVVLKNFKPDMFSALSVANSSTDSDND